MAKNEMENNLAECLLTGCQQSARASTHSFNIRSGSACSVLHWNYYLFMKWGEKCWFASKKWKHPQHRGNQRPRARLQSKEHVSMAAELYSKFIKSKKWERFKRKHRQNMYLRTSIQRFGKVLSGIVFPLPFFLLIFRIISKIKIIVLVTQ